jgi:ribosomal protein L11 methyltransferase
MIYEDDMHADGAGMPLWKTDILIGKGVTGEMAQALSDALEDLTLSVSLHNLEATDGDRWSVSLTTPDKPDLNEITRRIEGLGFPAGEAALHTEAVEQKDWLRHVHEKFPPFTAGRFFIYGSHYEGAKPSNLIPLQIDAATAFGSGEHETTKGCLLALESLANQTFKTGLDMGCGSGILAIAMVKLWPAMNVTAIDIDPESVVVTNRHAAMNGVEKSIVAEAGDGYASLYALHVRHAVAGTARYDVVRTTRYDIVCANILAGPLIAMAADLAKVLKPGGFCVLSGLLGRQMDEVVTAHEKQGLVSVARHDLGDWRALLLQKPA